MNSKVEWVSSNQEDYSNLFRKGAEDNFERLNHYTTLNPGKAVPVHLYDNVQEGQGERQDNTVIVKNITPTQQALEIAKSEMKDNEENGKSSTKKIVPVYKKKSKSGKAQSTKKFSTGKLSRKRSASELTPLEKSLLRTK